MSQVPAESLEVRTARAGQSALVLELLRSARNGRERARSMWSAEFPDVLRDLPEGLVHLGWIDGRVMGMFVLRWSDEQIWGQDDGRGGYLHRLATHPDAAGRGLGRRLVDVAGQMTARQGRQWLRLDCERDNLRLRAYYENQGFLHVRDVDEIPRLSRSGTRSARLYQRHATIR